MARKYTVEECRRKANQYWELAGLARQDGDRKDEQKNTELAWLWDRRASQGGWEFTKEEQP